MGTTKGSKVLRRGTKVVLDCDYTNSRETFRRGVEIGEIVTAFPTKNGEWWYVVDMGREMFVVGVNEVKKAVIIQPSDIISSPFDSRVKGLIGKEVWCFYTYEASEKTLHVLRDVSPRNCSRPFATALTDELYHRGQGQNFRFIAENKEEVSK